MTASSGVTREWREYERTSTAVLNAIRAARGRQLPRRAARRAPHGAGLRGPLLVMQSSAGTGSPAATRRGRSRSSSRAPREASPGAARIGERIGEPNLIYLDIGGTTAKCSLVEDATVPITTGVPHRVASRLGGLSGDGARRRHRRDRRRRRLDRAASTPAARSSSARRARAPIRAPPATGAEAPSRPSPTPSSSPECSRPDYFLGGRLTVCPELGARGAASARRAARPRRRGARQRHHPAGGREHDQRAEAGLGAARSRSARLRAARRRRRRRHARCGARRRARGAQGDRPAALGRLPAWGMCMSAPRADVDADAHPERRPGLRWRTRGALRGARGRRGRDARARRHSAAGEAVRTRAVDARYCGQEHTVRVPVAAGRSRRRPWKRISTSSTAAQYTVRPGGRPPKSSSSPSTSRRTAALRGEAALPARRRHAGIDSPLQAPARRRLRRATARTRPRSTSASDLPIGFSTPGPGRDRGADDDDAGPPRADARGRRLPATS